jgi:hypothetical protein
VHHGPGHPSEPPQPPVSAPGRELRVLGYADDPITRPLTYPGRRPPGSGLLIDGCFLDLRPAGSPHPTRTRSWRPTADAHRAASAPPGHWILDASRVPSHLFGGPMIPLDAALSACGRPVLADRRPVLAVGSNASPAQITRKLAGRVRAVVPMTYARVAGLTAGASAHVSRPGYVPAVPVPVPGAVGELVVLWLDDEQLAAVDRTEPNYHRVPPPASVTVSLPGLGPVRCEMYAGRHGCLLDPDGAPLRLAGQPALLAGLLATSPGLARLTGARTPEEFVARTSSDPRLRDEVRLLWRGEGRVLDQPELIAGRIAPS